MLLPCPFCGSSDVDSYTTLTQALIRCEGCGMMSCDFNSEADARKAWNTRTTPPIGQPGWFQDEEMRRYTDERKAEAIDQQEVERLVEFLRSPGSWVHDFDVDARRDLKAAADALSATKDSGTIAALTEALTPSAETKAAYIGEFRFDVMVRALDPDEDELVPMTVTVPWTTTKEIMAAIRERANASLQEGRQ